MTIVCGSGDDMRNQFSVRESAHRAAGLTPRTRRTCQPFSERLKLTSILDELIINEGSGGLNAVKLHFQAESCRRDRNGLNCRKKLALKQFSVTHEWKMSYNCIKTGQLIKHTQK